MRSPLRRDTVEKDEFRHLLMDKEIQTFKKNQQTNVH